jgi:hypothetical protein
MTQQSVTTVAAETIAVAHLMVATTCEDTCGDGAGGVVDRVGLVGLGLGLSCRGADLVASVIVIDEWI